MRSLAPRTLRQAGCDRQKWRQTLGLRVRTQLYDSEALGDGSPTGSQQRSVDEFGSARVSLKGLDLHARL